MNGPPEPSPDTPDSPEAARSLHIAHFYPMLGIGGAESYLWRLSTALLGRGHRVVLVTGRSGHYGERAREGGAEILEVPFTDEGGHRAIRELRVRDLDLVHAHNYRAARFARPLARELGVRYLMSVHGPRHPLKLAFFQDWSDVVVAMSEGDRANITGRFGVAPDRVVLGFYGVDTARFRPGGDRSVLRREWGVEDDEPLIVNVSRFTNRKTRPALALIEVAERLLDAGLNVRVALVGAGEGIERIRRSARDLNARAGRPVAIVAGARTDIPEVMAAADAAVATAQTALEAMACGLPTVAYGRTGHFGLVTGESFEEARAFCFADHGELSDRGAVGRLYLDLRHILDDRDRARSIGADVRRIVESRYSMEAMGSDTERIYREVLGL